MSAGKIYYHGDLTDEEDWQVRWYDEKTGIGDAMEYDTLEEGIEAFKASLEHNPLQLIYLTHYSNYTWEGDEDGWFTNPYEDTLLYWEGEDDPNNPLAEQMENLLSEVTA